MLVFNDPDFMDNYQEAQILEVSRQFQIYGDLLHAEPCKIGHINETYIAAYNQGGVHVRYVHQKLNTKVFKYPDAVMSNIERVTIPPAPPAGRAGREGRVAPHAHGHPDARGPDVFQVARRRVLAHVRVCRARAHLRDGGVAGPGL